MMDLDYRQTEFTPYFPISILLGRPTILTLDQDSKSAQLIPFDTAVFVSSEERMKYVLNNILGDHVHHVPSTQTDFDFAKENQLTLRKKLIAQFMQSQ